MPRARATKLATVMGALSSNSSQRNVPLVPLVSTSIFAYRGPLPLTPLTASASGTGAAGSAAAGVTASVRVGVVASDGGADGAAAAGGATGAAATGGGAGVGIGAATAGAAAVG